MSIKKSGSETIDKDSGNEFAELIKWQKQQPRMIHWANGTFLLENLLRAILNRAFLMYEHIMNDEIIHWNQCFSFTTKEINELQFVREITDEEWAKLRNSLPEEYKNTKKTILLSRYNLLKGEDINDEKEQGVNKPTQRKKILEFIDGKNLRELNLKGTAREFVAKYFPELKGVKREKKIGSIKTELSEMKKNLTT